jgi:hypothetical protein
MIDSGEGSLGMALIGLASRWVLLVVVDVAVAVVAGLGLVALT